MKHLYKSNESDLALFIIFNILILTWHAQMLHHLAQKALSAAATQFVFITLSFCPRCEQTCAQHLRLHVNPFAYFAAIFLLSIVLR